MNPVWGSKNLKTKPANGEAKGGDLSEAEVQDYFFPVAVNALYGRMQVRMQNLNWS